MQLLGREGLRALTHSRVDAEAGLPRGSTSNSFRTRAALLDGVVTWVAERELAAFTGRSAAGKDHDLSVEGFARDYCGMINALTREHRTQTLARYVLFLEGAAKPELRRPLLANRHRFEGWMEQMLTLLGAPDPVAAARAVMACGEGLILHRLTVDPEVAIDQPVFAVVRAVVSSSPAD